ncbi:Chloride channel protein [Roseibacterium elongatum DSM 19469]|uniref:Chloride channel protein n=1 Tax=Roseicyclus elongatus DSM 19469 TaxID=1294273 RepID=W8S615_9RHOB|nr:Chloride channel protein [Roseibacterium elongatum DSM 19469]
MDRPPPTRGVLRHQLDQVVAACRGGWRVLRHRGFSQVQFWFIALAIGIAAGFAALFFRKGINALQHTLYGVEDVRMLHSFAEGLPWYLILLIPVCGGLVVGLILHRFTPDGRVRSVADVIEGAALDNGRVEQKAGLASALASMITLGSGGSSGREGPVVHLAAVISTRVSDWIKADGITGRDLLGCAVAAAVSASFNAPIAGALFALEVVLRHFAVHSFAPIVIASVAGTVINRLEFGDVTEFSLGPDEALQFYVELPAFLILGLVSGLIAVAFMRGTFWAEDLGNTVQRLIGLPRWLRPAIAGLLLGALAIAFPHIIGVGYETTSAALTGQLLLHEAIVFAIVKAIAAAITIGGRMGRGRVFPISDAGGLVGSGLWPDRHGDLSRCLGVADALCPGRDGGRGGGGAGRADLDHVDRVRIDGRLADGAGGDGRCVAVHGHRVAAGGSLVLPDAAGTAQHPSRRRSAGLSAGHVPRWPGDAPDGPRECRAAGQVADPGRAGDLYRYPCHAGTRLADLRPHGAGLCPRRAACAGRWPAGAGGGAVPRRCAQGL